MGAVTKTQSWIAIALGASAFIVWFATSLTFYREANAEMFQRMGAFGVAAALLYFFTVKLPSPYAWSLHNQYVWTRRTADLALDSARSAHEKTNALAIYLYDEISLQRRSPPPGLERLAEDVADLLERGDNWENWEQKDQENLAADKSVLVASEKMEKARRRSDLSQTVLVVVATLQWGFGDCVLEGGRCSY